MLIKNVDKSSLIQFYYCIKPFIPRWLQLHIRHWMALKKRQSVRSIWPINEAAYKPPEFWNGWPQHKQFALVLTHDVDTAKGLDNVADLVQLEKRMGFRSAFYFVPERYYTSRQQLLALQQEGFEVGVHGLKHDGKLFKDKATFEERAMKINAYLKEWNVKGFRAPCMFHNLEWLHALDIIYDASTFDIDPFEPQPDSAGTIYPYTVREPLTQHSYVELPYTLPQDCTLFVILREKNINVWKRKLGWIAEKGGMALLITHPDYMRFGGQKCKMDEYPAEFYAELLDYIDLHYKDMYWHALPQEVADFCRPRAQQPKFERPLAIYSQRVKKFL